MHYRRGDLAVQGGGGRSRGVGWDPPVGGGAPMHYRMCLFVCVLSSSHLFWTSGLFVDVPAAGVTQKEGHTGFLHLPSAVLVLIFVARRIQLLFSLVDCEVEICVLTIY